MNRDSATIKEALDRASFLMRDRVAESRREAQALLSACLDRPLSYLLAHGEDVMDGETIKRYRSWINRRSRGEPFAYITGRREFMGFEFMVSPAVLIPRPETEVLVETVQAALSDVPDTRLLEVGTGSGAVAVSLAILLPAARIVATDLSAAALAVAAENAGLHGVSNRVRFLAGDLLEPVRGEDFDSLLSNPPYIPSGQLACLEPTVRDFEPRHALDGGPDGLVFYRRLAAELTALKRLPRRLFLEVGQGQHQDVAALCRRAGYKEIRLVRDLAGITRVVSARL
jgi:release factor glutamine methyltransferase